MAQMKAYTVPMKNWTLICGKEYLCRKVLKKVGVEEPKITYEEAPLVL